MSSQNELKSEISAILQDNARISSIRKASPDGSLARGVGFEPTRPLLTTDLAGLPPTRLGQPRKGIPNIRLKSFQATLGLGLL
jgi:hypothetical protein